MSKVKKNQPKTCTGVWKSLPELPSFPLKILFLGFSISHSARSKWAPGSSFSQHSPSPTSVRLASVCTSEVPSSRACKVSTVTYIGCEVQYYILHSSRWEGRGWKTQIFLSPLCLLVRLPQFLPLHPASLLNHFTSSFYLIYRVQRN